MLSSVVSTLRIIEDSGLNRTDRGVLRAALAKELMQSGDYEGASAALGELWRGVGQRPDVENLDEHVQALVLLRAGSLTGWLGSARQIADTQETAKDLIGESIRRFESLGMAARAIEGQAELALCYWREGAYDDARIILREALARFDAEVGDETKIENAELKALILIRSSIVEFKTQRFAEALALLDRAAPLVETTNNHFLKGGLHVELALNLRNLAATATTAEEREAYMDRALMEYAAASFHYEEAGHTRYSARVTNNLGYLYYKLGRYAEAHENLDRAREMFANLRDVGSAAQVDETRAQVFIAENRLEEAERAARASVKALEKGSERGLLTESLTTLGVVLARLGRHEEARATLERAIEEGEQSSDLDGAGKAALTLLEELADDLQPGEATDFYQRADDLLSNTTHQETVARLRRCAVRLNLEGKNRFSGGKQTTGKAKSAQETETVRPGWNLPKLVKQYEAQLIKKALDDNDHRVTKAAEALGISHQGLSTILQNRHRGLLQRAKPRKRRQQHIINVSPDKPAGKRRGRKRKVQNGDS